MFVRPIKRRAKATMKKNGYTSNISTTRPGIASTSIILFSPLPYFPEWRISDELQSNMPFMFAMIGKMQTNHATTAYCKARIWLFLPLSRKINPSKGTKVIFTAAPNPQRIPTCSETLSDLLLSLTPNKKGANTPSKQYDVKISNASGERYTIRGATTANASGAL